MLKNELDSWHHALSMEYRISIGNQARSEVIEVNMLYHMTIILLYRPLFSPSPSLIYPDIAGSKPSHHLCHFKLNFICSTAWSLLSPQARHGISPEGAGER